MKQAKKRSSPTLARLIASTQRTDRAITSALGYVSASNRRLAKHDSKTLNQLLAEMPKGLPVDITWENLTPVGLEIVGCTEPTAEDQMRMFMANARPADGATLSIRGLIDEGRD